MFPIFAWGLSSLYQNIIVWIFLFGLLAQRHGRLCACSSRYIDVVIMYASCL
jgi:hypothetical protein